MTYNEWEIERATEEASRIARNWLYEGEHEFGFYEHQKADYKTRLALRDYISSLRREGVA